MYNSSFLVLDFQYPNSTTIDIGEELALQCSGAGIYLYWLINGVNMTQAELDEQEINITAIDSEFSGNDSYQELYMYVTGSCANNNITVQCVVLRDNNSDLVSPPATITVLGNSTY